MDSDFRHYPGINDPVIVPVVGVHTGDLVVSAGVLLLHVYVSMFLLFFGRYLCVLFVMAVGLSACAVLLLVARYVRFAERKMRGAEPKSGVYRRLLSYVLSRGVIRSRHPVRPAVVPFVSRVLEVREETVREAPGWNR